MKIQRLLQTMICCIALCAAPASAYEGAVELDSPDPSPLENINNTILTKELELLRLNTQFRIESTKQPKWRRWRQFVYSETNASCTEASLIDRMVTSYPFMQKPPTLLSITKTTNTQGKVVTKATEKMAKAASPRSSLVEGAAEASMIGQFIAATGELFEISSNLNTYRQAKKLGLDPGSYRKQVCDSTAELDRLLKTRAQIIEGSKTSEIATAEGRVLQDIRDIAVSQYGQYHSAALRLRFFQNAAYLASITKNGVGAAGNVVNIESTHLHNTPLGGTASLLTLVAGVVTVATPVFGRVSGNLAGLVDRRTISKDFNQSEAAETSTLARDTQQFKLALKSGDKSPSSMVQRSNIYDKEKEFLNAEDGSNVRELTQAKHTTVENVVYGTIVGSSRIGQGVTGMIGSWEYPNQKWVAARLTAGGATSYGAGSAFNILETARVRLSDEVHTQRLAKQGLLPSQLLKQRLDGLEQMEKSMGVAVASARTPISLAGRAIVQP
ncbi:MAG TPA: hypothetical protein V6C81_27550 [Planktothrix sp.]